MGVSYDDIARMYAAGDPEAKHARQVAKVGNYGMPGGMGARTLVDYYGARGIEVTQARARELREVWLERFPEMRLYFDAVSEAVDMGGGAFTLTHPRSGMIRGDVHYTNGCNSPFQNLAACLAKSALWAISRECYVDQGSPLYGSRPVLLMHDEIIAEVPIHGAAEAAERLAALMISAGAEWLPDLPVEAEPWLCNHWTKDAETVRDGAGRLVEWKNDK